MTGPKLGPHDVWLVEADAQLLYEETCAEEGLTEPAPWAILSDGHKALFRSFAVNPYQMERRP